MCTHCTPISARWLIIRLQSTVSNADVSSNNKQQNQPKSRCLQRSGSLTSAIFVLWPGLKLDWNGCRMHVASKKSCGDMSLLGFYLSIFGILRKGDGCNCKMVAGRERANHRMPECEIIRDSDVFKSSKRNSV